MPPVWYHRRVQGNSVLRLLAQASSEVSSSEVSKLDVVCVPKCGLMRMSLLIGTCVGLAGLDGAVGSPLFFLDRRLQEHDVGILLAQASLEVSN